MGYFRSLLLSAGLLTAWIAAPSAPIRSFINGRPLLAAAADGTAITGTVTTPLPTVIGPIPVTQTSYPFNAASHDLTPIHLESAGYTEQEYIVKGMASVYSWPSQNELDTFAHGPYATRILVRRPENPKDFSGNIVVELLNPTSGFDVDIMWEADHDYFMSHGDAWVGITVKAADIADLQKFDPQRYNLLSMPNPLPPSQTCANPTMGIGPSSPQDEDGLAWDITSQVGALLRSSSQVNPLAGLTVRDEYLTGYSQTGGYTVTYINAIAPHFVQANGQPIFDGYLVAAGYGFPARINQCAPSVTPGGPQWVVQPPGNAPVIDVQTQSDFYALGGQFGERPDGTRPGNNYRLYQVPGASHIWAEQVAFTPGPQELVQAGFPANDWAPYCVDDVNPFPLQYVMDGAFDNLYRWVQEGIPAPTAARIQVSSAGATSTDVYGNALGGVRTPYLDVPTQTYYPTTPGTGSCELLWGHAVPFAGYFLHGLYATHHDYLSKVQQDAQSLMASKWLVPSDASQIELEADRSHIP